jgi:hypothetical protein
MKEKLIKNNFFITIGNHGLIFVHPYNKGNMFVKSFDSIEEAYNYYLPYLKI